MSAVPCSSRSSGTSARPLGRLHDGVVVAGDDVVPVPAAVHERLERQLEDERALGLAAGARRVDALRAAVGQRPVDDDGGAAAGHLDGQPDVLHDGPAPPVAGRERVEVGAEREPLTGAHPQRRARLDLVGVDRPPGRRGLPDRGVVEVLGRTVAADLVAVGVQLGVLAVDVEREDVEVAVDRHDLPLEQPAVGLGPVAPACGRGRRLLRRTPARRRLLGGAAGLGRIRRLGLGHSSTPPDFSSTPCAKCGFSLFSYIDSAEPMAMCMSRYL